MERNTRYYEHGDGRDYRNSLHRPGIRQIPGTKEGVIEAYQRLQRSFIQSKNYAIAGSLHANEIALIREGRDWLRKHFGLEAMYCHLAQYGLSPIRPFVVLSAILVIVSWLIMIGYGESNWDMTWQISHLCSAFDDYLGILATNTQSLFLLRNDMFDDSTASPLWGFVFAFQKIAAAVLVSFIVIGFRNRFRRF